MKQATILPPHRLALDKLEARAVRVAKFLGAQLRAQAIVSLNNGHVPKIELAFLAKFAPLLGDLMLVSNLQGRIDAKKSARQADPGLKLAIEPSGSVFAHTLEIMRQTLGPDVNLRALEERYNITALRTLKNVSDNVEKDVRETAYKLIEQGAHVKEAKQVLSERFDALGLTPDNPFQLETIFRTSSAVAYGAGSWAAYQDKDIQEILWGYQYTAVMDSRTRENHAAAEGVTLPKDDEFWQRMWPPNGYNCRCEIIPLYDVPDEIVEAPADAIRSALRTESQFPNGLFA
jgi:SPP1 gp7 family putative phage head morphogenesis protein